MNNTFTNRPVTMNENKNLLEIEEHMYILDDVKKPNVFRNMFPYSEVPKIPFNDRTVPHDMPKDIWITDTTFRDGQQSRAPYSTEQIVTIYDYLHRLGGENGLIQHRTQISNEFFYFLYKIRSDISLYSSNGVIVLYQTSSGSCFEDIQYLFTITESIEECGQGTHIHTETGEEKQVRVYTLQFVHNGTDVLYPFAYFYAHCLFNAHTKSMAVLVRT